MTGRFWSLIAVVQGPGVPDLIIVRTGPNSVRTTLAGHGQLYIAAESQRDCAGRLDHERLSCHYRQGHEQHHDLAGDGEPVLSPAQSVGKQ